MTRQGLIALSIILEKRPKTDRNRYARFARLWVVVVPSHIAHSTTSFIRALDNYILLSFNPAVVHPSKSSCLSRFEMGFQHRLRKKKKNRSIAQTIKMISQSISETRYIYVHKIKNKLSKYEIYIRLILEHLVCITIQNVFSSCLWVFRVCATCETVQRARG